MARGKKKRLAAPDPFGALKETVAECFSSLSTDFGFQLTSTKTLPPECWIEYRNATTGVTILQEWGSLPEVQVSRLGEQDGEVIDVEKYSVDFLVRRYCPDLAFNGPCPPGGGVGGQGHLRAKLDYYAEILKQHARDILTGDFSRGPEKVSGTVSGFSGAALRAKSTLQPQPTHDPITPRLLSIGTTTLDAPAYRRQFRLALRGIYVFHPSAPAWLRPSR